MIYTFSEVLEIHNGKNQRNVENKNGNYPIYGSGGIIGFADKYLCDEPAVIIGRKGSINNPIFVDKPFWNVDTAFALVPNSSLLDVRYLYYFCLSYNFNVLSTTVTIPSLTKLNLLKVKIEVPSLEEQKQIVHKLDKIEMIFGLKERQLKDLEGFIRSRFLELFGNVGEIDKHKIHDSFVTKLGDVANVKSSHRVFTSEFVESGIPFYRGTEIGELSNGQIPKHPFYITREHYEKLANDDSRPKIGDLLLPSICNNGQIWLVDTDKPFYYKDGRVLCISPYPDVFNNIYLLYYLKYRLTYEYPKLGSGSTFAEFKIFQLKNMDVLVPNIMKQNLFANFIHQVDKSKMAVQKSLDELETLKKSLMQTYFG